MKNAAQSPVNIDPLFVAIVIATASFSINGAIPASSAIGAHFDYAGSAGAAISSAFAAGYGAGHLIVGVIADRISKKRVLLFALSGFSVASLLAVMAPTFEALLAIRFFQALFASACPVIGRVIVRREGAYEQSAKKLSSATAIFTWMPVFAPLAAAFLVGLFGWQSVFFTFAAYGAATAWLVRHTPSAMFSETSVARIVGVRAAFGELIKKRSFWAGLITASGMFAGFYVFLATSGDIFDQAGGFAGMNGAGTAIIAASFAIGGGLSRALLQNMSSMQTLQFSVYSALGVGVFFLCADFFWAQTPAFMLLAIVFSVFAGVAAPNATILVMRDAKETAAMSIALLGGAKMILAALVSGLLAFETVDQQPIIIATIIGVSFLSVAGLLVIRSANK